MRIAPIRTFLLWCAGFFLIAGCQSSTSGKDSATSQAASPSEENGQVSTTPKPQPDTILRIEGYGAVPVYQKFSGIEPLFHRQNDTTYVINFWATWCKPCVAELPYFEALNQSVAGQKVKVILVSLDFPRQLESKLAPFIKERQLQSRVEVLLDGKHNEWIDKVSPEWTGAIPATIIYRGENRRFVNGKVEDLEELHQLLAQFQS